MSSGQQITFATKEVIPLTPSPCKEFVLNRVKSASDDKENRFVRLTFWNFLGVYGFAYLACIYLKFKFTCIVRLKVIELIYRGLEYRKVIINELHEAMPFSM